MQAHTRLGDALRLRGRVLMRVMFWAYTVVIALGLTVYVVVGLMHQ